MIELIRLVYLAGAPAALAFPVYYHFTAHWYKSREGRLLMFLGFTLFCLYLSAAIAILFPDESSRNVIRLVLVSLAATSSWALLLVYRKIRREGRMMQRVPKKQEQE